MSCGQENLHLLVRWCQLIGLSPFRMEKHPETGRFQRFSFSWKNPLTAWWLGFKVLLVAMSVWLVVEEWRLMLNGSDIYSYLATKTFNYVSHTTMQISTFIFSEVLVLRYSSLAKTSRHLRAFDDAMVNSSCPPCSTRKRTAIGIATVSVLVKRTRFFGSYS